MRAFAVALAWTLTMLPAASQAASEQDLSISYIGLQPGSKQDLKFTVYNVGIGRTPATQASFQVTKPSAGTVTKLPVPSLAQNQSTDLTYHLAAPCAAGTVVHAEVALSGDAHPNDNSVETAACSPDLQLAIVGFAPGSLGDVQVVVTNRGSVRSATTTATVETVSPGPPNVQTYSVPPLDPGGPFQVLYTLGGATPTDCDGHQIRAALPVLVTDADTTGKIAEATLCAPKPPPPPPPPSTTPEFMRPGTHTLDFRPSTFETYTHSVGTCELGTSSIADPDLSFADGLVGWSECDGSLFSSSGWNVWQTAARFDLKQLDDVGPKLLLSASLTFNEKLEAGDFGSPPPGCVVILGTATSDWVRRPATLGYPNDVIVDARPGTSRNFDVTTQVRDMNNYPTDPSLRYGFVLRGAIDGFSDVNSTDGCLSAITNLQLHVTYLVPDQH